MFPVCCEVGGCRLEEKGGVFQVVRKSEAQMRGWPGYCISTNRHQRTKHGSGTAQGNEGRQGGGSEREGGRRQLDDAPATRRRNSKQVRLNLGLC